MNDSKATKQVECPCCHGDKFMLVHDEVTMAAHHALCCHCSGTGKVAAEVDDDSPTAT